MIDNWLSRKKRITAKRQVTINTFTPVIWLHRLLPMYSLYKDLESWQVYGKPWEALLWNVLQWALSSQVQRMYEDNSWGEEGQRRSLNNFLKSSVLSAKSLIYSWFCRFPWSFCRKLFIHYAFVVRNAVSQFVRLLSMKKTELHTARRISIACFPLNASSALSPLEIPRFKNFENCYKIFVTVYAAIFLHFGILAFNCFRTWPKLLGRFSIGIISCALSALHRSRPTISGRKTKSSTVKNAIINSSLSAVRFVTSRFAMYESEHLICIIPVHYDDPVRYPCFVIW